jgi:septum formation protein
MTGHLILASASPRRRELLGPLGLSFEVEASALPETPRAGEAPADFAQRMAREKAQAVAAAHPGAAVLGADTIVVVDGAIVGKPTDVAEARRMLARLSGCTHTVITAVALVTPGAPVTERVVESTVEFRPLSAAEIEAYVATGEPLDKAGAYAIQGGARRFVRHVRGSYTNVIGLPLDEVRAMLGQAGFGPIAKQGGA